MRESINISQLKMAETAGLTQSSLNRYENGQSEAPYRVLHWYADYFDVSMDYIFGRTDRPQGKLYKYEPEALKARFSKQEDWQEFIEACFDSQSPMNAKLKEMMLKMAGGDGE